MQAILSRKDRQLEKMERVASKGLHSVNLQLYSSEAKKWGKKGFTVIPIKINEQNYGIYSVEFNFPELLKSPDSNRFIVGISNIPQNLSYAEKLYLLSRKSIFEQLFID